MKRAIIPVFSLLLSTTSAWSAPATPVPLPPASPYLATTAGQFAADCKSNRGGCADLVGNVLMDKINYSPTSHICLPGVNYAEGVAPWLLAHPETANMPAADGIYLALTSIYVCGAPNNY
ncbi:MAG: hypothetical protein ACXWLJ_01870 [Rhizomicrobium sp.]